MIASIVVSCWAFNQPLIALGIFAVIILIMGVTQKSLSGILPILGTTTFIFSDLSTIESTANIIAIIGILLVIIVSGIIFTKKNQLKLKFSPLLVGFVLLFIASFLGGITTGTHFGSASWLIGTGITLGILLIYFVLSNVVKTYTPVTFAKVFVIIAIVMVSETWIFYFRQELMIDSMIWKTIHLGWGIGNNVGLVLIFSIPFVLYVAMKSKYASVVYILLYFLTVATVFAVMSRGSIIILAVCIVPMTLYAIRCARRPMLMSIYFAVFLTISIILAYSFLRDDLETVINSLQNLGLSDRGRIALWKQALVDFNNSNIIFGAGFGFNSKLDASGTYINWYHNPYIQMLSNLGALGLIAFLVHIGQRYYYMVKKRTKFSLAAFYGSIMSGLYGLIDVTYFIPCFLAPMLLVTLMMELSINEANPISQDELLI